MGKIQVPEDTAEILQNAGYTCECRGPTHVKGKGTLTTYYVKTSLDEQRSQNKFVTMMLSWPKGLLQPVGCLL